MREIAEIAQCLAGPVESRCWLATVVGIEGSAYRRPGARLLFSRDGKLAGGISGGCLEREVLRTGEWLAQLGPVLRTFDAQLDGDDGGPLGSGCNGKVEILIEEVMQSLRRALQLIASELEEQRPVALATVLSSSSLEARPGQRLVQGQRGMTSDLCDPALSAELGARASQGLCAGPSWSLYRRGDLRALLELLEPAPHLSLFGTGDDAVPVARLAAQVGFDVTVHAPHGGFAARARFNGVAPLELGPLDEAVRRLQRRARPFALVMSHDYEQDRATLAALLRSRARYIGMLGPARRTQRMLSEIEGAGAVSPERLRCVYGPAGLHLGGEGPQAIALAVVAEAQAVLNGAGASFLRERKAAIHERDEPALRLVQAEGARWR